MAWNWQQTDWPNFQWKVDALAKMEAQFLHQSGVLLGAAKHLSANDEQRLIVDMITGEAMKTSEIEGEYLNRDSVQSSIRRNFGLDTDNRHIEPAERGIADMMSGLYRHFNHPLSHATLYEWHTLLVNSRQDLKDIGSYRTHEEAMQVVSGRLDKPTIHFEALPSKKVKKEMDRFIKWFANSAPNGKTPLPPLTRAGIAHLYFVCIHPFEDGNGRIGRAIAEKALSENLGAPTLIALSQTIESKRKAYYDALEHNNKNKEITDWLIYFSEIILKAQNYSLSMIDFLIEKTKLYDRVRGQLNARQEKVIERIFREGIHGFKGGLSAENYISITGTSRATTTRDLRSLVDHQVLIKTGERKSVRYWLNIAHKRTAV